MNCKRAFSSFFSVFLFNLYFCRNVAPPHEMMTAKFMMNLQPILDNIESRLAELTGSQEVLFSGVVSVSPYSANIF